MHSKLNHSLRDFNLHSRVTVLTGAGISAESGIPTFRGPEGFWTIGSEEYHPQEMATLQMFKRHPEQVWSWYLYRLGICKKAQPNQGHLAIEQLERLLDGGFCLITQNVDNLHLLAGNSPQRTLQIHGNLFFMRCINECRRKLYPLPDAVNSKQKTEHISKDELELLRCPDCGNRTRPHVLWFDEAYDEHYFQYETALITAQKTELLIVAGTSGATTLPMHIARTVFEQDGTIIDINIEDNPFSEYATASRNGIFLETTCSEGLTLIMDAFNKMKHP